MSTEKERNPLFKALEAFKRKIVAIYSLGGVIFGIGCHFP